MSIEGCRSTRRSRSFFQPERRGWAIRHWKAYREHGFEGLIDARLPREPKVSRACREAVQAARAANPKLSIAEALKVLQIVHIHPLPSESTLRTLFARVDGRRRYAAREKRGAAKSVDLAFAGGELVRAAEAEVGLISVLTDQVAKIAEDVREASAGQRPVPDPGPRDERGHFTAEYNHERKREPGEKIASYLRSAEEKARGQVLSGLRFVHEQPETIEQKVAMLVFEPMVNPSKGWEGLRAEGIAGVEPLTGFAYMPSTLSKFTAGLARCAAGPTLLEAIARRTHEVAQGRWGEAGAMAALYVDNHAKEVWSSLFTKSGKVSHLNRVMPCITSTYVHSGAGTALHVSVQSGAAPLAPRLVEIVDEVEAELDDGIRRAVVIDSEGSTFDILTTFSARDRIIVTPLKPSRLSELEVAYAPGSYFRRYRENDELRIARVTLHHKSTNRSLDLHGLIVRREHRDSDTILLTNGIQLGMAGRDLADLYYRRWPLQENAFKEGKALHLAEHRGNCGTMVSNVAIVTEMERLEKHAKRARETLAEVEEEKKALERARREHETTSKERMDDRRRLNELAANTEVTYEELRQELRAHGEVHEKERAAAKELKRAENQNRKNDRCRPRVEADLKRTTEEITKLEPSKNIRQLDVALDTVLTAMKLAACFLLSFVMREYLSSMPMSAATFLTRVLSIRGRREVGSDEERVVFYENPRDPEITKVLVEACARLNKRELRSQGRRLSYDVEAPPEGRPPSRDHQDGSHR